MKEYNWKDERKKRRQETDIAAAENSMEKQTVPRKEGGKSRLSMIIMSLIIIAGIGSLVYLFTTPAQQKTFEQVADKMKNAVGMPVIQIEHNGKLLQTLTCGTAWAFSPTEFATNAHVANGLWQNIAKYIVSSATQLLLYQQNCKSENELYKKFGSAQLKQTIEKEKPEAIKQILEENKVAALADLKKQKGNDKVEMMILDRCKQIILKKTGFSSIEKLVLTRGKMEAAQLHHKLILALQKELTFKVSIRLNQTALQAYNITHVQIHPDFQSTTSPDVAVFTVDKPIKTYFRIASKEKLYNLKSGREICMLGFPSEDLLKDNVNHNTPIATFQQGNIVAVSDFDLKMTVPENQFWIRHNLPVAGGASGSPIFDIDGDVIALVNSGNMFFVRGVGSTNNLATSPNEITRIGNAAQINNAIRADLLYGVGEKIPINKWLEKGMKK